MTKNTLSFPSLKQVRNGIKILKNKKWDKFEKGDNIDEYIKKINNEITSIFNISISLISPYSSNTSLPFKFYRMRSLNEFKNLTLRSEYSYPPLAFCNKSQRANLAGFPVFYCSDNPGTAAFETVLNDQNYSKEKEYLLSVWEMKDFQKLKIAPFLFDNLHNQNPYRVFTKSIFEQIPRIFNHKLTKDQEKGLGEMLEFYSQMFFNDTDYVISSYLAHSYLYMKDEFRADIFIYPSIQTNSQSVNFAIAPNITDEQLLLKRIYLVRIKNFDVEKRMVNFSISQYGLMNNSILKFYPVNTDNDYKKIIAEDFQNNEELIIN